MTLLELTLSQMETTAALLEDVVCRINALKQDRSALLDYLAKEGKSLEDLSDLPEVKRLEKAFDQLDSVLEN